MKSITSKAKNRNVKYILGLDGISSMCVSIKARVEMA
jgi:hypothetical protein